MTTTARPGTGQRRGTTPRVLLTAGASVLVVVLALSLVGSLASGSAAGLGAAVGGGLALFFLLFGSVNVYVLTSLAPQMSMLVALMTFTLQVLLVVAVFYALDASGAVGETLAAGWVATGVVTAAVTWILAQLVASARARVPAYDIDLPGESVGSSEAHEVGAR